MVSWSSESVEATQYIPQHHFGDKHMENALTTLIGENFETLVGDEEL